MKQVKQYIYIYIYIYVYIYIKQVKQEKRLATNKDDYKMRCILEALQGQKYKSKK